MHGDGFAMPRYLISGGSVNSVVLALRYSQEEQEAGEGSRENGGVCMECD